MKLLFVLCIVGSLVRNKAQAQIIFTPHPGSDTTSIAPHFKVTIMGRPLGDTLRTSNVSDTTAIQRSVSIDSVEISDSQIRIWRDSLGRIENNVKELLQQINQTRGNRSMVDWLRTIPSILPVRVQSWSEYRVSSYFGMRIHPVHGSVHNHAGIDLPRPMGDKVYATADGRVDRVINQNKGLGVAVYIIHESKFMTVYGHLNTYNVKPGQLIKRGEWIGEVGMTGQTTGPHLHYSVLQPIKGKKSETILGWKAVNPLSFCFLYQREMAPVKTKKSPIIHQTVGASTRNLHHRNP